MVLYILDLLGVFIFALTGAMKGIKHDLDLLGLAIIATLTGLGGGITRDLILGYTPPFAFQNTEYILLCVGTAIILLVIYNSFEKILSKLNISIQILDAVGLGVFAGIGAAKAYSFDFDIVGVSIIASLTAVGGGVLRDIFIGEIPSITKEDFYAMPAILGGVLFFLLKEHTGLSDNTILWATINLTFLLRLPAIFIKMNLPKVKRKI